MIKGQTGPSATFTVRNDGTAPVSFRDITIPAGFPLIDDLDSTLDPLETDSFVVQLDSAAYGTPTGEITIDSNDPEQSPFHFTVTGIVVGNAPEIRVFLDEEELTSGSGSPVVFDPVAQGKVGSTLTFVVANYGVKDLTLGAVTLPVVAQHTEPVEGEEF